MPPSDPAPAAAPAIRPGRAWWHHPTGVARAATMVVCCAWIPIALVILVLRYAVLPHVADYRDDLQKLASRASGEAVTIGAVEASWRGLRPSLALHDVAVVDASGRTTLRLPSATATLSWRSLAVFQLRLSSLEIDDPLIVVERDRDGRIAVAGHPLQPKTTPHNAAVTWLFAQDRIGIQRGTVVWHDALVAEGAAQAPPDLVLGDVALAATREGLRHRLALRAAPPAAIAAPIDVRAVIDHSWFDPGDDADPARWSGELYADVASGDVAAWRAWVPLPATLAAGRGRFRAWLRFTRADRPAGGFAQRLAERIQRPLPPALDRIAEVTTDFALDDVAVRWGTLDYAALASLDGRVVATQAGTAQRLTGTRVALQPHGPHKVAATDFDLQRTIGATPDDEAGKASLGAIDIATSLGLVPEPLVPPAIATRLVALNPHGALESISVSWSGPVASPRTFDADVRFAGLGIAAQAPTAEAIAKAAQEFVEPNGLVRKAHPAFGQPGFERLSGTLHATRKRVDGTPSAASSSSPSATSLVTDAAIVLASDDVVVSAPGLFDDPTLRFAHLAAHVGVRVAGDNVEIRVDQATLDNADLAGSVDLVYRHGPSTGGPADQSHSALDLAARLSRGDVGRMPRYLPNIIGPKARAYLAKALVAGKLDAAELRLRGTLEQLDPRRQTDALARPYAVPIDAVLKAPRPPDTSRRAVEPVGRADPSAAPILHAAIRVHDATFLYGPARDPDDASSAAASTSTVPSIAWPAFRNMDADIVFDAAHMTIDARTARYRGFVLEDIHAELPALADPAHVLRVVGRGRGPLQDLVHFINEGPMQRWVRHLTDSTEAEGDATLALAFDLPLTHPRDARVAGSIGLERDELALNAIVPPFRRIEGRVDFTDRGLSIERLTARALGGPLRIAARTSDDGFIEMTASGTVDIAELRAEATRADGPAATAVATAVERVARLMSGSTTYQGVFRLRKSHVGTMTDDAAPTPAADTQDPEQPKRSDLVFESDLVGLAFDLPPPFAKPAEARWPLRVELSRAGLSSSTPTTPATDSEDIHVALADRFDAKIRRQRDAEGVMAVANADYRIGDGASVRTPGASTEARVAVPSLDLDGWRDVVRRVSAGRQPVQRMVRDTSFDALLPARIGVTAGTVHAAGRDFTKVTLAAVRIPTGWQADLDADEVAGHLSYTDVVGRTDARNGLAAPSNGLVVARLSRLSIPQADPAPVDAAKARVDGSPQQDFPAIDLIADRFELRGRLLGRLAVEAENVGAGPGRAWKLDKLDLLTPEARLAASGTWGHDGDAEDTRLDFDLQASDVGALMDRFGLTRTIKDGSARLSGNATWSGGPTRIDFTTLSGTLQLAADRGEFLKADPGVAKLLNIISLQGLARRIRLDFSDVFGPGFAFDTVRAHATVEHGIATTDDFVMRGGLADVEMKGSADLQHETADLHVRVLPQINAGAASLGVAVINPVVGLGTFVAQYLFKDRISQALSFEYNVSGPWKTPEVIKIDRNGKVTPVRPKPSPVTSPAPVPATLAREPDTP